MLASTRTDVGGEVPPHPVAAQLRILLTSKLLLFTSAWAVCVPPRVPVPMMLSYRGGRLLPQWLAAHLQVLDR